MKGTKNIRNNIQTKMISRSKEAGVDYEDDTDLVKNVDLEHCEKDGVMTDDDCETLSKQWCDKLVCPSGVDGNCLFKNNIQEKGCCIKKVCETSTPNNKER